MRGRRLKIQASMRTPQLNLAVAHREFRDLGIQGVRRLCRKTHVVYDIKHVFRAADVDGRL
jgi:UDP-N-acetyl-D-galactosamine dehydrogenase